MRYLLPLLIAFPAYAAPVCNNEQYHPVSLKVLQEEWKEIVASGERICIIARLEWAHKDNRKKLDVAMLQTPTPSEVVLMGSVNLSMLARDVKRQAFDKCGSPTTGEECVAAIYGQLTQSARLSWMIGAEQLSW